MLYTENISAHINRDILKIRWYTLEKMDLMELHCSVHECIKPDGMTSTALCSLTHNTIIYKIR